jgi:putative superfamily III holin-X
MPGQDDSRGRDTTVPPGARAPGSVEADPGSASESAAAGSGVPEARAPYDDREAAEPEAAPTAGWAEATEHEDDRASFPAASVTPDRDDNRSLGQLVASASRDMSALLRDEIELAKAELKESAVAAGKGAGMFGAAAFLAYVAFLMLSIAAGYGLVAAGLHPAIAFLIVGGVYLLVAGIVGYVGTRSVRKAGPPARTKQSIEEAKALVGRGNGNHHD